MKRSFSPRRLLAAAAGLVIGLAGTLALSMPAQAQEQAQEQEGEPRKVVDCQWKIIEVDREGDESPNPHAWRAVLREDGESNLLLRVLWQSGDWEEDASLGTDVPDEWTIEGSFEVRADIDNAPNGIITLEWWNTSTYKSGEPRGWKRWGHGPKIEWNYENPCRKVGEPVVTQPTCETPGTIEIPATDPEDAAVRGKSLTYSVNGEDVAPGVHEFASGTYEVVGYRVGGKKDYRKEWTIVIVPPEDCPEPTPEPGAEPTPSSEPSGGAGGLPVTGSQTMLFAGGALALLAVGTGLFLLARRRRITFTS